MILIPNCSNIFYDTCQNSCDVEGSDNFHKGCHPALYAVIDKGEPAIRCYECLIDQALDDANDEFYEVLDEFDEIQMLK